MDWKKMSDVFARDEWMKRVVFSDEWLSDCKGEADKQKKMEYWCDCNVAHIMFRDFGLLSPDWRPVIRWTELQTGPYRPPFLDLHVNVACSISYKSVFTVRVGGTDKLMILQLEQMTPASPSKSIRWEVIKQSRIPGRSLTKWIAVVRNVVILRDGDFLENSYDVFKFPEHFHPIGAGWHKPQEIVVATK